jgi:hypothetical protein
VAEAIATQPSNHPTTYQKEGQTQRLIRPVFRKTNKPRGLQQVQATGLVTFDALSVLELHPGRRFSLNRHTNSTRIVAF